MIVWLASNWWWLSAFAIPLLLGLLKVIAKSTKNVHDDKIVTLLTEWWGFSRGLFRKEK